MNLTRLVSSTIALVLVSTYAMAQIQNALPPPMAASSQDIKFSPTLSQNTVPPTIAVLPLSHDDNSFHRQWGLGATLTPGTGFWYVGKNYGPNPYFFLGILGDLLWRVHPRVTLHLSGGILGDVSSYSEYPISLGLRVYLRPLPQNKSHVYWMPYLAGAFLMTFQVQSEHDLYYYEESIGAYVPVGPPKPGAYLGGGVGLGVELRYKHHLTFNAEIRGVGQGSIDFDPFPGYPKYLYPRLGLSINIGLTWYF